MLVIAIAFTLFDLLNNMDIPTWFVLVVFGFSLFYSIFVYGITPAEQLALSISFGVIIVGMLLNSIKWLGLADSFLIATLTLLMPFQNSELFVNINQHGFPFFVTLLTNMLIPVMAYALIFMSKKKKRVPFAPAILASLTISLLFGDLIFFLVR